MVDVPKERPQGTDWPECEGEGAVTVAIFTFEQGLSRGNLRDLSGNE